MLTNDLQFTARTLLKAPVFTLTGILTLALGIGANTAIFSVVNAVMLRALPFPSPDRLVWVAEKNDKLHLPWFAASVLNYLSWREEQNSFEQLGAIQQASYNLTGAGVPQQFPATKSVQRFSGCWVFASCWAAILEREKINPLAHPSH